MAMGDMLAEEVKRVLTKNNIEVDVVIPVRIPDPKFYRVLKVLRFRTLHA
jgi:hypothetical protein